MGWEFLGVWGGFWGSGVDKAGIGYRCPPVVCLIGSPDPTARFRGGDRPRARGV